MCAAHYVVLLAEETWNQIPAIITMHARPGDVCALPYIHENKNFFALGRDERPRVAPLKHVSYFWRNPKAPEFNTARAVPK
jgi:hypothetical protein